MSPTNIKKKLFKKKPLHVQSWMKLDTKHYFFGFDVTLSVLCENLKKRKATLKNIIEQALVFLKQILK